jgi:hypothetical protein
MGKPSPLAPPPLPKPAAKPNRRQRRRGQVFNKKLAAALSKDESKTTVKVLPDEGLHVQVDARDEASHE